MMVSCRQPSVRSAEAPLSIQTSGLRLVSNAIAIVYEGCREGRSGLFFATSWSAPCCCSWSSTAPTFAAGNDRRADVRCSWWWKVRSPSSPAVRARRWPPVGPTPVYTPRRCRSVPPCLHAGPAANCCEHHQHRFSPGEIAVRDVRMVVPGTDARRAALGRRYSYEIGTDAGARSPFRSRHIVVTRHGRSRATQCNAPPTRSLASTIFEPSQRSASRNRTTTARSPRPSGNDSDPGQPPFHRRGQSVPASHGSHARRYDGRCRPGTPPAESDPTMPC